MVMLMMHGSIIRYLYATSTELKSSSQIKKKKPDPHVQPTKIHHSPSSQPLTRSIHSSPLAGDASSPDSSSRSIQIFNPFSPQPSINVQIESLNENGKEHTSLEIEMENSRNVMENSRNIMENSRNTQFKEHTTLQNEMDSRMGILKENELEIDMEISKNILRENTTLENELEHSQTVNPILEQMTN